MDEAERKAILGASTYPQVHPELMRAAAKHNGGWTILDFFDSVPWTQTGADWTAWRAFLAAVYALPMTDRELAIYRKCTGRWLPPDEPATEAWVPSGRRARKSAIEAVIASYVGAYRDHSEYLAPGELARIPVLSKTKEDAQQIKRYVDEIFTAPSLSWLVVAEEAEAVCLSTRVEIAIRAATISAGRGPASPCAILDEVAFFRSDESAHPDKDIVNGIKGSFANVTGTLLVGASSPYARRGLLYTNFKEHYRKEKDRVLVWMAPTVWMHDTPAIRAHVAEEHVKDPVAAAAEYGKEDTGIKFREDVEALLTEELLDAATAEGVTEVEPCDERAGIQYVGFIDASGGRSDSFVSAIAHWDGRRAILDSVLEVPAPFDPLLEAMPRVAAHLGRYRVKVVEGDEYAGEWVVSAFRGVKIGYQTCERSRSEIYVETVPLFTTAGKIRLLDHPKLRHQLLGLDRRVLSGGREVVDHKRGEHDDVANAVTGVMVRAAELKLLAKPDTTPRNPLEARAERIKQKIAERIRAQADGDGGGMPGF